MLINYDPDEWKTVSEFHTCAYHKQHPHDIAYAGCCCSASIGQVRRDPTEVAKIKADRRRAEDDEILRKAEAIKITRGHYDQ
jgi:hypothetical protein